MTADANRTNSGSGVVVGLGLIGLATIVLAFVRAGHLPAWAFITKGIQR